MHGDGINFTLFHLLWLKQRTMNPEKDSNYKLRNELNFASKSSRKCEDGIASTISHESEPFFLDKRKHTSLRIPDTVIFHFGQPVQWYFTSQKKKGVTILRKRKQNLTIEKVEEVFIQKTKLRNNGWLDTNEIVAYFVTNNDCTSTHHLEDKCDDESANTEGLCNIEYFDKDSLCEFEYCDVKPYDSFDVCTILLLLLLLLLFDALYRI